MTRLPLLLAASMSALSIPAASMPAAPPPEAARAVVRDYYAAIDRGDYRRAYRAWSDDGRASGKSFADFARGFAGTRRSSVAAGRPTDQEGGAGSIYSTVPVDVHATLKDGRAQHFRGSYILRRVNDVDGATTEQRRWHIASATLKPVRP